MGYGAHCHRGKTEVTQHSTQWRERARYEEKKRGAEQCAQRKKTGMEFALVCKHVKTPSTVVTHSGHRQGRNGQGRRQEQEVDFTVTPYCLGVKPCELPI